MRRAFLAFTALCLVGCNTSPNQALFVTVGTYDAAEKAGTAAITAGLVNQATADRIKACDVLGYGLVQPLAQAEAAGQSPTTAIVQSATNGLTSFSACLGSAGVTVPVVPTTTQ